MQALSGTASWAFDLIRNQQTCLRCDRQCVAALDAFHGPSSECRLCLFIIRAVAIPQNEPATRPTTSPLCEYSGATIDRNTPDKNPSRAPISVIMARLFIEAPGFMVVIVSASRRSAIGSIKAGPLWARHKLGNAAPNWVRSGPQKSKSSDSPNNRKMSAKIGAMTTIHAAIALRRVCSSAFFR